MQKELKIKVLGIKRKQGSVEVWTRELLEKNEKECRWPDWNPITEAPDELQKAIIEYAGKINSSIPIDQLVYNEVFYEMTKIPITELIMLIEVNGVVHNLCIKNSRKVGSKGLIDYSRLDDLDYIAGVLLSDVAGEYEIDGYTITLKKLKNLGIGWGISESEISEIFKDKAKRCMFDIEDCTLETLLSIEYSINLVLCQYGKIQEISTGIIFEDVPTDKYYLTGM